MSGLKRYSDVLHLFDETRSDWTIPDIAGALDVPASTVYRTVRDLLAENFLEPATEGHYRLGSAFVAFDRLIRLTDPIVRVGNKLLRDMALQARVPCVGVLARLYGDTVMCVAETIPTDEIIQTSYERGRPRPLTRGATSKVILAQLPTRHLNSLLTAHSAQAPHALVSGPAELREELALIRKRGFCVTHGEVDQGLVGIAAPVTVANRALTTSLSLVVPASAFDESIERRLVLLVVSAAGLLTEELSRIEGPVPTSKRKTAQ
jgi:DNA-binding IclR family transcriptional regulator